MIEKNKTDMIKEKGGNHMGLENFHIRLSNKRKEIGYTQEQMALRLGVTPQAISKWERGIGYPDIEMMYSIAKILQCSMDEIYDYDSRNILQKERQTLERREEIADLILKDSIILEISMNLVEMVNIEGQNGFEKIHQIRKEIADTYGILVPIIRIKDNIELEDFTYQIFIQGKLIQKDKVYYPKYLCFSSRPSQEDDIIIKEPIYGKEGIWTQNEEGMSSFSYICTNLKFCILKNYDKIINKQIVQNMLTLVKTKYPAVIENVIPNKISLLLLEKIILRLIQKKIAVNNFVKIIELLEENLEKTADIDELGAYVEEKMEAEYKIIENF